MTTWVLVADNSRARFFSTDKAAGPLVEFRDLAYPEGRLHEGDLVTDKGGRDRSRTDGVSHGLDTGARRKQDGAERFALLVCDELEQARTRGELDKLYVIAAPAFLGLLRQHQSPALRQLVAAEHDKNLTTHDLASIRRHLPDYL